MDEILNQVKKLTGKILNKDFKPLDELDIPKRQGIYIIKEKTSRFFNNKNKLFYIGKSTNLFNRIIRQHISTSDNVAGSILRKKLHKKGLPYNEIRKYLKEECLFITQDIEDFDITALVEDLLIAILRKQGEPLINNIKEK